jgi:hypothetical protein
MLGIRGHQALEKVYICWGIRRACLGIIHHGVGYEGGCGGDDRPKCAQQSQFTVHKATIIAFLSFYLTTRKTRRGRDVGVFLNFYRNVEKFTFISFPF